MPPSLRVVKGGTPNGVGLADYFWPGPDLLSKTKSILVAKDDKGEFCPILDRWTYEENDRTLVLVPCHYLPDPIRPQPSYLCLCEVRDTDDGCVPENHRKRLRDVMDRHRRSELIRWGFEQPYELVNAHDGRGRHVAERHLGACLDAGLLIHSAFFDPDYERWEFKVGVRKFPQDFDPDQPSALVVADHLLIARHLMKKIAAEQGVSVEWGGLSVFVSTAEMQEPGDGSETHRLREALVPMGRVRAVPNPTHGGVACLELRPAEFYSDPYAFARDVTMLVRADPMDS